MTATALVVRKLRVARTAAAGTMPEQERYGRRQPWGGGNGAHGGKQWGSGCEKPMVSDMQARNRTRFANVSLWTDDAKQGTTARPRRHPVKWRGSSYACQTPPVAHIASRQERRQRPC